MGSAPSSHVTWQGTQGANRQLLTSSQLFPSSVKEVGGGHADRNLYQREEEATNSNPCLGGKHPGGKSRCQNARRWHLSQYSRIARSCRSSRSWRSRRPPG